MNTAFATSLNWNTFTAAFGLFLHGYRNLTDRDIVWSKFAPWIVRFGYEPAWYDAKYTMMHVLEILDEDFAE